LSPAFAGKQDKEKNTFFLFFLFKFFLEVGKSPGQHYVVRALFWARHNSGVVLQTPLPMDGRKKKNNVQLLAMDISVPISMKNAANCDT